MATEAGTAQLIDGKGTAATIRTELKEEVEGMVAQYGKVRGVGCLRVPTRLTRQLPRRQRPGLATVLIGDRKDSATYVRMKKKACDEIGIKSVSVERPDTVSQDELIGIVRELNANEDVHGILVQVRRAACARHGLRRALPDRHEPASRRAPTGRHSCRCRATSTRRPCCTRFRCTRTWTASTR